MKAIPFFCLLMFAGCTDIPSGYFAGPQAYTTDYFVPPPPPAPVYQSDSFFTPGATQPFTYYNYSPITGTGSLWTPNSATHFTYFNQ